MSVKDANHYKDVAGYLSRGTLRERFSAPDTELYGNAPPLLKSLIETSIAEKARAGDKAAQRLAGHLGAAQGATEDENENESSIEFALTLEENRRIDELYNQYMGLAEAYRVMARKAQEDMDKISAEMTQNSKGISDINDLLTGKDTGGKFDKEKALEYLKGLGIRVDKNISEEDLRKFLEERARILAERNAELSRQYELKRKELEEALRKAAELEEKARKLLADRAKIKEDTSLTPEEKEQKLRDLSENADAHTLRKAAELSTDKAESAKLDEEFDKERVSYVEKLQGNEDKYTSKMKNNVAAFNDKASQLKPLEDDLEGDFDSTPASNPLGPMQTR